MIAWALSFFAGRRPLGMALLAAGRRGAAAAGPPCGGSLRPGPRSVPRLPRARPLRGSAPGRTRWGAWAAPAVGGGPLSPARAPGGAARGPLLGAHGSPCSPPVGPAPTRGGRGPPFPPRRPLGRSSGAVLRRPRLRRVGALACSAPGLSAAWPFFPRRFLPQPSPLPPPVPLPLRGRGKRKRLTPAAAGTGGARLPQRTKKPPRLWLLPPAKRHKTRILFKNTGPTKRARPSGSAPFLRPWFLSGPRPDVPSGCARKSRPSIAASRVFSALGLRRCGPTK